MVRRIEHWTMAGETAKRAAASLLAGRGPGGDLLADFQPLPYFWTEQQGVRVQGLGLVDDADESAVLKSDGEEAVYGHLRGGRLVAVTLVGRGARLAHYRQVLLDALATVAQSTNTVSP